MPKILTELRLDELSLVTEPANKDARVSIFKSAGTSVPSVGAKKEDPKLAKEDEAVVEQEDDKTDDVVKGLETKLDDVSKRLLTMEQVEKLSSEEFDFYKKLNKDEQPKFLDAEVKVRKSLMSTDETIDIGGQLIRKSDVGDTQFALIRHQKERTDQLEADLRKSNDAAELALVEKQVVGSFDKVVGKTEEKTSLLAVVKRHGTKDDVETLEKILRSSQEMVSKAFDTVGEGGEKTASVRKSQDEFQGKVRKIAEEEKISKHLAMSKARDRFPDLFKEAFPNNAE